MSTRARTKHPKWDAFFVLEVTVPLNRPFRLRKLVGSNLKAKLKRLSIVLTTLFSTKQGVWGFLALGKKAQTTMRLVRHVTFSQKGKDTLVVPFLLYVDLF